jgi:hypothetical protein
MHAINTSNHPQKSSCLIDRQQPSSVFNIGLSKVKGVEHRNHHFAEVVHQVKTGGDEG